MQGTIVYIGNFVPPIEDAVAKRALGLGLSFELSDYSFYMIGESEDVSVGEISDEMNYRGVRYCCIHKSQNSLEHFKFLKDVQMIKKRLSDLSKQEKVLAVIICGTKCALMANSIVSYCKKMGIPIIADSMDWLTSNTGSLLFDFVKNMDIWYELHVVNMRADALICISSYLSNYYSNKKKKTIIIPPISPYNKSKCSEKSSELAPKVIYAGVPCRLDQPLKKPSDAKDRLDIAIQVFYDIYCSGINFIFDIYGMSKEQYLIAFPDQVSIVEELLDKRMLYFHGRVKEYILKEELRNSDYTILLREKNRISEAGFSTKLAESVAIGIPVITTDTSDILTYLIDGKESVIVDVHDYPQMIKKITEALTYDSCKYHRIQATVNLAFAPSTYCSKLDELIKGLV